MNSRPQLLKQLNGIRRGRIELSSIYDEWKVKTFYVYKEMPGYVLNSALQPVDPDIFNDILFSWPSAKLKISIQLDSLESIIKSIKKFVFHGSYDFLKALVPEETATLWEEELAEKQKLKEKKEEEARLMQERMEERWATLHPLNQEWGIPAPPTDIETENDRRLNDWVHQYQPYMYERNGRLMRKIGTARHELYYEQSYADLTFPSDMGFSAVIHRPIQSEERGAEVEGEMQEASGVSGQASGENEAENHSDTVIFYGDEAESVEPSEGPRLSPSPFSSPLERPGEAGPGGEASPPRKYSSSDLDLSYNKDMKIKRIANAMEQLWGKPADRRNEEAARAAMEWANRFYRS